MKRNPRVINHGAVVLSGLIASLAGWAGLFIIFQYTPPTLGPRWLFFFFTTLAVSGTVLPFVAYLHLRFPSQPPAGLGVMLRQALWFGIYTDLAAWLQLGRVLKPAIAMYLLLGVVAIELILRIRETASFNLETKKDE